MASQELDVNNDGVPDFILFTPDGLAINLTPLNHSAILAVPEPPSELGALIYAFPSGATISASIDPLLIWFDRDSSGGSATIVAGSTIGSLGYFQGHTDAYAGVRIEAAVNFYYGWLHIQNLGLNIGQISDWAYESGPNTTIFAGAVPEPATWTLVGLGLVAWFCRRK
jgi:hypothetical protein